MAMQTSQAPGSKTEDRRHDLLDYCNADDTAECDPAAEMALALTSAVGPEISSLLEAMAQNPRLGSVCKHR